MRRADFVQACLALRGTPFHHQGRTRTAVDCLGLILLAAQECGCALVAEVPPYARSPNGAALRAHLEAVADIIPIGEESPGDLLVFAWDHRMVPQHFGVFLGDGRMIHTNAKVNRVNVEPVSGVWQRRLHSVWRLHRMED